jgi:2-polyprenyl-3-methyl-5-hydroxy-6-metoxy-1,4-benzoquinol methylase
MCKSGCAPLATARSGDDFAGQMVEILNHAALGMMISIGHRTRLFDTMATLPPATSVDIAKAATLNERYVREWLAAMVTSGIVDYDPSAKTFALSAPRAAMLTRRAGSDNLAVVTQFIAELGSVESQIVECFHRGGGVPYAEYHRFHEVMAEESGLSVLSSLEDHVLPLVPALVAKLTAGASLLDVGCGRGLIIMRLAELFPRSQFIGIDLCSDTIAFAQAEAERRGLANVDFRVRDASDFDQTAEPHVFDVVVTFDSIHDQAKPLNVLRGIYRTLKDDGIYLMQDINGTSHLEQDVNHPLGTLLYTISCMHCMTVSLAQGGEGLGAMWGEQTTRDYLAQAGFQSIDTHRLDHDIQNNWYVITK